MLFKCDRGPIGTEISQFMPTEIQAEVFQPRLTAEMVEWTSGFIQASFSKIQDFSRTSKSLSYSFQGLNLSVKILLLKC